jgi:hypothetical protein
VNRWRSRSAMPRLHCAALKLRWFRFNRNK